jgi:hypothetical protein
MKIIKTLQDILQDVMLETDPSRLSEIPGESDLNRYFSLFMEIFNQYICKFRNRDDPS